MIDELDLSFDDDWERGRHRRRRAGRGAPSARGGRPRKRRGRSLFALFVTLVLLAGLAAGGRDIAKKLYDAQVVKSTKAFVNAFDANPQSKTIEVGYYRLRQHMKATRALDMLLARNPDNTLANRVSSGVTITEGMISLEVFTALSKSTNIPVAEFQNLAKDPVALGVSPDWFVRQDGKPLIKSIEGFLYPATYEFDPGTDATTILKKIVANFNAQITKLDFLNRVQSTLHI